MKKLLAALLGLGVLIVFAGTGEVIASHTAQACDATLGNYDPILCPDPTVRGASCVAYGILVTQRDITGTGAIGDATVDLSESRAWTWAIPGEWPQQSHQPPAPPSDPQAHADAQQVGIAYTNTFFGHAISTSTIFSQCDVVAVENPLQGLYTQAYGRGGVEDLSIVLFGTPILAAEVLDFEADAYGLPWATYAFMACDELEVDLFFPPSEIAHCPPPNTGFTAIVGALTITVEQNEEWGPVINTAGQWVYGGAVLHVTATLAGVSTVDVYVGYVSVAVTGGPPSPPFWVPDFPTFPLPCVSPITC